MQPIIHFEPTKTAAFTADKEASRLLFSTAAELYQPMRHLDVKSAFTAEPLQHDRPVFVRHISVLNVYFLHPHKQIDRLLLNLYGTNNAIYIYIQVLDSHLRRHGYILCEWDSCVYFKTVPTGRIFIAATVDDFLVKAPSDAHIDALKHTLSLKYIVTDLGPTTTFLGRTINRNGTGPIHFPTSPHRQGPRKIRATKFQSTADNIAETPDFDEGLKETLLTSPATWLFQSLIGYLLYFVDSTRVYISLSISRFAQHLMRPTNQYIPLLNRTLRHLIGTTTHGLLLQYSDFESLSSFSLSYYAAAQDMLSTTGHLHTSFGAPISWCSKIQSIIAVITCEEEYLAAIQEL